VQECGEKTPLNRECTSDSMAEVLSQM